MTLVLPHTRIDPMDTTMVARGKLADNLDAIIEHLTTYGQDIDTRGEALTALIDLADQVRP
jgi:hypothetical protein